MLVYPLNHVPARARESEHSDREQVRWKHDRFKGVSNMVGARPLC
jgi:hypothetical protein